MRDDETPTFNLGAEVAKANEQYFAPSFAEIVQDRASELLTLDRDDGEWKWQRREQIFNELYTLATKELANGKA